MDKNNLFRASSDEVATWIERTFIQLGMLELILAIQVTLATAEHDWYSTDDEIVPDHSLVASSVFNVDDDFGGVSQVSEATLLRRDWLADAKTFLDIWLSYVDVQVLDVEVGVSQTGDLFIRL